MQPLPVEEIIPELQAALSLGPSAVLQAPPGAGKTTRVPLALIDEPWLTGQRIVMLEPRRLACRAAARRMAALRGERPGGLVGYRMRLETRVSAKTRIEVVTEGILTRMLQDDPGLSGVGLVIFDEFHERNLNSDLALALSLDVQRSLREDLRLLVMSATLDAQPVARLLRGAPVITGRGRMHPVEIRHRAHQAERRGLEGRVAGLIREALRDETGSLLVFLPGAGEIRRVEGLLEALPAGVSVAPLYGDLPGPAQDRAIQAAGPGERKVVLATSIAETSLTIEGVRVVIDSGWMRQPRFSPATGMSRLETLRVSRAAADQRTGRAGRLEPGVCYRLWPETDYLLPFTAPEILAADLAPLMLELALWGSSTPGELAWLDEPPAAAVKQARELLTGLEALDDRGRITGHGRLMAASGIHPRLAHMIIRAQERGSGSRACEVAALLGERDTAGLTFPGADLSWRLALLERPSPPTRGLSAVRDTARLLRRRFGLPARDARPLEPGYLLALAFPDRIAQRRPQSPNRYVLTGGTGAWLDEHDPLSREEYLACARLDGRSREARIFLAAPLEREAIEELYAARMTEERRIAWDPLSQAVAATRQLRLGGVVLREEKIAGADKEALTQALLEGIRREGLGILPWNRQLASLCCRVRLLARIGAGGAPWPDLSEQALLETLESWLAPYAVGVTGRRGLQGIDLEQALLSRLSWEQRRLLDELAPTHITVPSGSRIAVDYAVEERPVLAVRLQELFGLDTTPAIAGGRMPLTLHLLSPAGRPVQVTGDLASFWRNVYPEVRRELQGRYPRHHWPEDPLAAPPTARAKRRG